MTSLRIFTGIAIVLSALGIARGEVIISEIMFNPASKEDPKGNIVEWVEIYNTGDKAVDISGWYLQDEDGKTTPLPRNTTIKAGQAVVLVPVGMSEEKFRAAWGEGFDIYVMGGWTKAGMNGLANNPSEKNELLSLRKADGKVADDAHYKIDGDWPKPPKPAGGSLILKPEGLSAKGNDDGKNWVYATPGKFGAKNNTKTEEFNGNDIGSPGIVGKE